MTQEGGGDKEKDIFEILSFLCLLWSLGRCFQKLYFAILTTTMSVYIAIKIFVFHLLSFISARFSFRRPFASSHNVRWKSGGGYSVSKCRNSTGQIGLRKIIFQSMFSVQACTCTFGKTHCSEQSLWLLNYIPIFLTHAIF